MLIEHICLKHITKLIDNELERVPNADEIQDFLSYASEFMRGSDEQYNSLDELVATIPETIRAWRNDSDYVQCSECAQWHKLDNMDDTDLRTCSANCTNWYKENDFDPHREHGTHAGPAHC